MSAYYGYSLCTCTCLLSKIKFLIYLTSAVESINCQTLKKRNWCTRMCDCISVKNVFQIYRKVVL